MITLTDQLFLSSTFPLDSRHSNIVVSGNSVIVETSEEYLARVDLNSRYLGMEVKFLTPPGTYEIDNFVNNITLGGISAAKYKFANISDTGLLPVTDSVVVIDDLTTGGSQDSLSAEQGVVLKDLIDTGDAATALNTTHRTNTSEDDHTQYHNDARAST